MAGKHRSKTKARRQEAGVVGILKSKPIRYWAEAVVLSIIGIWVGHYIGTRGVWLNPRYSIYSLMQKTNWRRPYVQHTFVVTVDDNDFWKGEFDGRAPVRRDLLGCMISRLADAEARVIAVDFDLRSPVPGGSPRETPVYQHETDKLLGAIDRACAAHHAVVLPATIGFGTGKSLVLQSDIYSGAKVPPHFFFTGYIALPDDARAVPLDIKLADQTPLDSFALAAVRAYLPDAVRAINDLDIFPFGGYLDPGAFPQLSAASVLRLDKAALQDQVGGKLVFIGSAWHRLSWKTGPLADSHITPVGPISGVFVHANYAEAILGGNYYWPVYEPFAYAVEMLVLFAMAIVFAIEASAWKKVGFVLGAAAVFISVGYVLLQNLGIYFDFLIPLVFLLLHVAVDRILEWRRIALSVEGSNR
jgi:CHASE2 domain-containing sensor protein